MKGQDRRVCSADGGTSGYSGLFTNYISGCQSYFILGVGALPETRKNITSTDSTLKNPYVGNDDLNYLWQILLSFELGDVGVANDKEPSWTKMWERSRM